jgi:hypothetical protein
METIIGFVAGYLAGAKEGKEGLDRLKSSVEAIARSPEVRRMATEAMSLTGTLMRRASARGITTTASGVAELVMRRVSESGLTRRQGS